MVYINLLVNRYNSNPNSKNMNVDYETGSQLIFKTGANHFLISLGHKILLLDNIRSMVHFMEAILP